VQAAVLRYILTLRICSKDSLGLRLVNVESGAEQHSLDVCQQNQELFTLWSCPDWTGAVLQMNPTKFRHVDAHSVLDLLIIVLTAKTQSHATALQPTTELTHAKLLTFLINTNTTLHRSFRAQARSQDCKFGGQLQCLEGQTYFEYYYTAIAC